jgi:PAS domain-containing protein
VRRLIPWNNTILFDRISKAIGAASIGQDITEPRQVEEALRGSEEKFYVHLFSHIFIYL